MIRAGFSATGIFSCRKLDLFDGKKRCKSYQFSNVFIGFLCLPSSSLKLPYDARFEGPHWKDGCIEDVLAMKQRLAESRYSLESHAIFSQP